MKTESLFHSDPEDIFAKAIERVEAGEAIEAVLATAPEAMRAELREVLLLITATHHLQRAPVPQPPTPRRADRKRAFLEAAAQIKAETALDSPPAAVPAAAPKPRHTKSPVTKAPLVEALSNFWRDLQASFAAPNLRLAPLLILIVAVYLGAFGFKEVAQAAKLGDLAYPVKQWIDYQELSLSSEEVRPAVYGDIETRISTDVSAAQTALGAAAEASGHKVALITTESFLVVKGIEGDYLLVGPLRVLMKYQPDPNVNVYIPMVTPGIPGIGSQVELTFQIISDDNQRSAQPLAVQGRALTVITEGQLAFDNSKVTTPVPPAPTPCQVTNPGGWEPYPVQSGDSLATIAEQTGATVAELIQANCLEGAGATITNNTVVFLAPKPQPTTTPTSAEPPLVITLTVYSTKTLTPSIEVTATVAPTDTMVMTPTPAITGTVTVTGTPEATTTISATLAPTPTVVETITPSVTVTSAEEATEDANLKGTLTATAPITGGIDPPTGTPVAPTVTATPTPALPATETTPVDGTPTAAEVDGTTPSPAATPRPGNGESPTAVATPTAANPSDNGGGTTGQEAPTVEENAGNTADGPDTRPPATATPIPQSRSPLTGG